MRTRQKLVHEEAVADVLLADLNIDPGGYEKRF